MCIIPWESEWLRVTPARFELMVVEYLRGLGRHLRKFEVTHHTPVSTPDGEFDMDAVARFEALGSDFLVLVECKHHRNPIKRELVQVLADKLSSAHGQKAILFSTAPFQAGAIEYAQSRRIALVHFTQGGPIYETRALNGPTGPNRPYDAWSVTSPGGTDLRYSGSDEVAAMLFGGAS